MTEVNVPGFPPRQLQRHKLIIQSLERHGGERQISVRAWMAELGIEPAQFKKVDWPFLVWCGVGRQVVGRSMLGQGSEPSTWYLQPGWDWVRYLESCGELRQRWLRERAEVRSQARREAKDLAAGKIPKRVQTQRDRAREMIAAVPEKPGPIFVDDPLVNREIANVDDDYLLTWG